MTVTFDFTGKIVLVTGGASGIGLATATAFAQAGAHVVVADISEDAGSAAIASLQDRGWFGEFRQVDVADERGVATVIADIVHDHGRLDIAHNNAGIESVSGPLADLPSDDWRRVIDVNLSSVFYCLKAEIPAMLAGGGGAIVNTASAAGLIGGYGMSTYSAAKHGVIGLTKSAAMDYAKAGIRINAVCPGPIDTPFLAGMPPKVRRFLAGTAAIDRFGQAEEIAQAVLWLCSDSASYVVGHSLSVDGGVVIGGDRHEGIHY
jgi:NAD(P)-dependent dehydrogenase (short-subunit alcohol dehydrogenase family)